VPRHPARRRRRCAGTQIDEATTRYLREVATTNVPLIGICTGNASSE
jgi:hypothetical protein